jgi:hypothetical protein
MEARGWIYYQKRQGSSGSFGAAFLEVQTMLEPSKRHVLEMRQRQESEEDNSGDPPTGGAGERQN